MAWNLDLQKTLPLGMVMNLGYNGARSNHLDVQLAPRALPTSAGTDPATCFQLRRSRSLLQDNTRPRCV